MSQNWLAWMYEQLASDGVVLAKVAQANIHPSGSIEGSPETKPFIVFKYGNDTPALEGDMEAAAERGLAEVWFHDTPGSYKRINELLDHIKKAWPGPVASATGGIACRWLGNSPELSDDGYGTITRYASFEMTGAVT